mmetsp:Transcript_2077/g.4508  ORF Transcript_2077/g.4508 Transcript_2077/m.4508 type:complete len:80 (+) Transcript_2077:317-556(+)
MLSASSESESLSRLKDGSIPPSFCFSAGGGGGAHVIDRFGRPLNMPFSHLSYPHHLQEDIKPDALASSRSGLDISSTAL